MGIPELRPERIPVLSRNAEMKISEMENVGDFTYPITAVSMGNPHAVIFTDCITDRQVLTEGPQLEIADINTIEMRVWERGTGETLACGTGACATAVAAVLNNLTGRKVEMRLRGGVLHIHWDEMSGHVFMTGPAEFICDGEFYLNNY